MADYIKREDAVCAIRGFSKTAVGIATEALVWAENVILDIVPSADVAEVKHGEWLPKEGYDGDIYWDCSNCGESWTTIDGEPFDNGMNYCPHCGARMDGE